LAFFSFFLNHEEAFLEFNSNLLETNLFNILILLGILVYANKVSFSKSLSDRQLEIFNTIENAQKDVVSASNYYYQTEKGLTQSFFGYKHGKFFIKKKKLILLIKSIK